MPSEIKKNPTSKEIRSFGLIFFIGFAIIGALLFRKNHAQTAQILWGASAFILILSWASPRLAKPFYFLWMALGLAMGFVMSRIVMSIIFYGLITPVALFFRLKGRDVLKRQDKRKETNSYWSEHPPLDDKTYYEHLF